MLKNQLAKRVLLIFAAVFILLSSGGCGEVVNNYNIRAGLRNYKKENFKQAYKHFKEAADNGDGRGQYLTAEMYRTGEGVEKNLPEMLAYYEKAAANTNTPEEFMQDIKGKLGVFYLSEKSVLNSQKGEKYLTEAANMKDGLQLQLCLGAYYHEGVGVKKDYKKAFEWISKAAGAEIADGSDKEREKRMFRGQARGLLGEMYLKGEGTAQDAKKAFESYKKAAEDGCLDAEAMMALMYVTGEGVAKDRSKGMEMLRKQAAADNPKAKEVLEHIKKNNL